MFWLAVASPLVIAVVGRPLVMASVAAANVLLVDVRRLVEASAPAAATVSNPLVTDGRARPFVTDAPTKPLINVPAAVTVSKPLVMASVAAASVLLVAVSRLVEANAPAAMIVSSPLVTEIVGSPLVTEALTNPLVIAVVGKPLVMASVTAANVLLVEVR